MVAEVSMHKRPRSIKVDAAPAAAGVPSGGYGRQPPPWAEAQMRATLTRSMLMQLKEQLPKCPAQQQAGANDAQEAKAKCTWDSGSPQGQRTDNAKRVRGTRTCARPRVSGISCGEGVRDSKSSVPARSRRPQSAPMLHRPGMKSGPTADIKAAQLGAARTGRHQMEHPQWLPPWVQRSHWEDIVAQERRDKVKPPTLASFGRPWPVPAGGLLGNGLGVYRQSVYNS
mmetsp:Transcript_140942/g.243552  ORF Transcript_140942/g.243552 Transcript_140942/m.243552 type:complete len:227 (+) Transcript_140942:52-732(+)